ncbi:MAG: hypothetical protein JXP73_11460 [Deltaproteobacteria bacterium]|nr:hypothetical protein [Deltaproteobacteria bacterium]
MHDSLRRVVQFTLVCSLVFLSVRCTTSDSGLGGPSYDGGGLDADHNDANRSGGASGRGGSGGAGGSAGGSGGGGIVGSGGFAGATTVGGSGGTSVGGVVGSGGAAGVVGSGGQPGTGGLAGAAGGSATGGTAGGGAGGGTTACTVGSQRCSGNALETCSGNGQWGAGVPCVWPTPVCSEAACRNATLTVTKSGNGAGTVSSSTAGINCGPTCSAAFSTSPIALTATPTAGSTFEGWSGGGCSGTGTCSASLTAGDVAVTAVFTLQDNALGVSKTGAGTGTVTSSPAGIDCGQTCSASFEYRTSVTLTATPASGSLFTGWSGGGCSGTGTCTVSIRSATSVTANFALAQNTLTISRAGTGSGTVTSTPTGINCGATCSAAYAYGASVTLTATPATGSGFAGWSGGGCSGTGTCTVSVTAATTVTANFTLGQNVLTVDKAGTGSGTVTSSPAGINCGSSCSASYAYGTSVTLTATPVANSDFAGWSGGGCSGTGTCTVAVTAATTVTASFALKPHDLTVNKSGDGSGNVASSPAGIACGDTCVAPFDHGASVVLTATAADDSSFAGWTGAGCAASGTGPCTVSVTAATTVTARFSRNTPTLTVDKSGSGEVKSDPEGIDCGATCAATFDEGASVALTATPAADWIFSGWSGDCTGDDICGVVMTAAKSVTATFSPILTVGKAGNGNGTVTSDPTGIDCGTGCQASFAQDTEVELTATPAEDGSSFAGWSGGGCSGTDACTVEMTAPATVTATFVRSLACTSVENAAECTDGDVAAIDLGALSAEECHAQCPTAMALAGMTSGCWIVDGEGVCHCRSGALASGEGTLAGGSCALVSIAADL